MDISKSVCAEFQISSVTPLYRTRKLIEDPRPTYRYKVKTMELVLLLTCRNLNHKAFKVSLGIPFNSSSSVIRKFDTFSQGEISAGVQIKTDGCQDCQN